MSPNEPVDATHRWSLHMREAIKTWRERKRAEVEAWEPWPMPEDYDTGR